MYEYKFKRKDGTDEHLLNVIAHNITEADEIFESWTGKDPTRGFIVVLITGDKQ